jgi:hypothetical protein
MTNSADSAENDASEMAGDWEVGGESLDEGLDDSSAQSSSSLERYLSWHGSIASPGNDEAAMVALQNMIENMKSLGKMYLQIESGPVNKLGLHWLQRASKTGVIIYTSPVIRSKVQAVQAKFTIRCSKTKVRDLLLNDGFLKRWDASFDHAEVLKRIDDATEVRRLVYKGTAKDEPKGSAAPSKAPAPVPSLNLSALNAGNTPDNGKNNGENNGNQHTEIHKRDSKPGTNSTKSTATASSSSSKESSEPRLPRDFIVCRTHFELSDGSTVIVGRSVPDKIKPEVEGYVRGVLYMHAYHIRPSNNWSSDVTFVIHADVRDNQPPSLINLLRTTAPLKKKLSFIEEAENLDSLDEYS